MSTGHVCTLADGSVTVDLDRGVLIIKNAGPSTIAFQFYGVLTEPIKSGGWLAWQPDPGLAWLVARGAADYASDLTTALRIVPTT